MLYQNGGVLYEGQGADYGIRSGLYSEAAMKTFVDYTKFFTAYKVPVQADFPNRFRTGEMPLGIYASSMYNTLELLAPEIRGLWSMHGIPGRSGWERRRGQPKYRPDQLHRHHGQLCR